MVESLIEQAKQQGVVLYLKNDKLAFVCEAGGFPSELKQQVAANKQSIIDYLQAQEQADSVSIEPQPHVAGADLSLAQQRLWFVDQFEKGHTSHYNMANAFEIEGLFDVDIAEQALKRIIERHQVVRCVFRFDQDSQTPKQWLIDADNWSLNRVDLTDLNANDAKQAVQQLMLEDAAKSFDLTCDVMLRASWLSLAPVGGKPRGVMLLNMHHIASDGQTMAILVREFCILYQALSQGLSDPLTPLSIQYSDYARWQAQDEQRLSRTQQLTYWQQQLADVPAVHSLPLDFARKDNRAVQGAMVSSCHQGPLAGQLKQLANRLAVTPFMLLHGVFSVLLSRHSHSKDIVLGTPVNNRPLAELEPLMGFFINTLVLRTEVDEKQSFADFIKTVKQVNLDGQANQDIGFEHLIDALDVVRSTQHSPLFQIMFAMNTVQTDELSLPGLNFHFLDSDKVQAKFDLELQASVSDEEIKLDWIYDANLFCQATIERLDQHFERLLQQLIAKPNIAMCELSMLTDTERHVLLTELNQTQFDTSQLLPLPQQLELQVGHNPNHPAVIFDQQQLSYQVFNHRVNQLATYLQANQAIKVALYLTRSMDMVVAIWATLKAGAAYLPIEPTLPIDRVTAVLNDSQPSMILTHLGFEPLLEQVNSQVKTLWLDDEAFMAELANNPVDNPTIKLADNACAYIIYTSGSTGVPKGVECTHKGLINRVNWMQRQYQLTANDKVLQKTPYGFDVSVWEFIWPLTHGGTLVVAKPDGHKDPNYLAQLIDEQQVSLLHFVPSMLEMMLEQHGWQGCNSVRDVFCSGEALPKSLQQRFFQLAGDTRLHNLYGPTEAAIDVSFWQCQVDSPLDEVPIGAAIDNTQLVVLDQYLQLVPLGCVGQLYIGGDNLALGYLNRPELTAERFIENPFEQLATDRLYATGDLVRFVQDPASKLQQLMYLGRADDQIKLRGLRIELGEIVAVLQQLKGISSAVVKLVKRQGQEQLVAYGLVSDNDDKAYVESHWRQYLAQKLPDYMVPTALVLVDEWPKTASGKINRKALPLPDIAADKTEYVAPRNAIEQQLCDVWQQLLQQQQVGIHDDFFALGGHSLLSVRVVAAVRALLGVEIDVKDLFSHQTVALLAAKITRMQQDGEQVDKQLITPTDIALDQGAPLSFAQQRLWFIEQFDIGERAQYNLTFGYQIDGWFNPNAAQSALQQIVERHQILRTVYRQQDNQVLQYVQDVNNWQLQQSDFSQLDSEQQALQVASIHQQQADASYDLSQDVMLRGHWIKLAAQRGILLLTIHHIATDGWSMNIIADEFVRIYHQGEQLTPLELQYRDFSVWQRQYFNDDKLAQHVAYWQQQLKAAPLVHNLPLDKPRQARSRHLGAQVLQQTDSRTASTIKQLAAAHGVTPFMLLHGVLTAFLCRYSNSEEIVLGTPVANRRYAELDPLVGFFVNTLALRSYYQPEQSFVQLLGDIKQLNLDAQSFQDMPFEQLVELLEVTRDNLHTPIFQIMFSLNNTTETQVEHDDLRLTPLSNPNPVARFELEIGLQLSDSGLTVQWLYDTDLFEHQTIERMSQYFERLLQGVLSQPELPIAQFDLISSAEQDYLLSQLNHTQYDTSHLLPLALQLEQQVIENPEHPALVMDGESISYQAFNQKVNQLTALLRTYGADEGQVVALLLTRSVDMVVAIWACLKSGAAYLPIEPSLPVGRVSAVLQDSQPVVLLSQSQFEHQLTELTQITPVYLDDSETKLKLVQQPINNNAHIPSKADACAYMIYTSGSTGMPKGVVCTHKGLINRINWMQRQYQISADDKVLQKTPYGFDVSVWEFVWPLTHGGTLVVAKPDGHKDPNYLAQLIDEQQVSLLHFVPSMLEVMLEQHGWQGCNSVRDVFCSGEALPKSLQQRFFQLAGDTRLHNLYGPTEAAIDVSFWQCQSDNPLSEVPIGRAIDNTQLVVLDACLKPVPLGCVGQLYIGGDNLAMGYLNRPELTAERFIENPFEPLATDRLYATGDLVRFVHDSQTQQPQLVYLGRIDDQVKLRGLRIELGEIAAVLQQLQGVSSAVIKLVQDKLVAYVLVADQAADGEPVKRQWRSFLAKQLPDYMVPSALLIIDSWPKTASGKIDRKALPEPSFEAEKVSFVAPSNEIENALVQLWQQVLTNEDNADVGDIGVNDNFFALGGNSMLAIGLINQAQQQGLTFSMAELWQYQTIKELATKVVVTQEKTSTQTTVDANQWLELLPAQQHLLNAGLHNPSHFNTATMVELPLALDMALLSQAAQQLLASNSALTMAFSQQADGWRQRALQIEQSPLTVVDLTQVDEREQQAQLRQHIEQVQSSLAIGRGELLRLVVFELAEHKPKQLLFICHHLVTDTFASGVIVDRLSQLYLRLVANDDSALPWTDDYAAAINGLKQLANDPQVLAEFSYWDRYIPSELPPLPVDYQIDSKENTGDSMIFAQELLLDHEDTRFIIKDLVLSHKVQSVSVVLYAMSRVIAKWNNDAPLLVGMGRYGREVLDNRVDLTHTLGWHAMTIPIMVATEGGEHCYDDLQALEQQLGQMPYSGSHYGLLKYLCDEPQIKAAMAKKSEPKLTLNYFPGDPDDDREPFFKPVDIDLNPYIDAKNHNAYDMTFWIRVIDGCLGVNIQYCNKIYRPETIAHLIGQTVEELALVCKQLKQIN